jgi:hypothetical protein
MPASLVRHIETEIRQVGTVRIARLPAQLRSAVRPYVVIVVVDALYPGHALRRSLSGYFDCERPKPANRLKPRPTSRAMGMVQVERASVADKHVSLSHQGWRLFIIFFCSSTPVPKGSSTNASIATISQSFTTKKPGVNCDGLLYLYHIFCPFAKCT